MYVRGIGRFIVGALTVLLAGAIAGTAMTANASTTASGDKDLYWHQVEDPAQIDNWHCSSSWGTSIHNVFFKACMPTVPGHHLAQAGLVLWNGDRDISGNVIPHTIEGINLELRYTNGNYVYTGYHCLPSTLNQPVYVVCLAPTEPTTAGAYLFAQVDPVLAGEKHKAVSQTVRN